MPFNQKKYDHRAELSAKAVARAIAAAGYTLETASASDMSQKFGGSRSVWDRRLTGETFAMSYANISDMNARAAALERSAGTLPEPAPEPDDEMLIVVIPQRKRALLDRVLGVIGGAVVE